MAETHEREVLIRIKLEADKQRNKAAETAIRQSVRNIQQEADRGGVATSRKLTDAVKQQSAAMKKAMAEQQRMVAQQRAALDGLGERFSVLAESSMRFGRGLAMLGASGEKDLEKLLRKLVKIQAAFDLTVGGFRMLQGGSQLWNQLGKATGLGGIMGSMNAGQAAVIGAGGAAWAAVAPSLIELAMEGKFKSGGAGDKYLRGYAGMANRLGIADYLPWQHMRELAGTERDLSAAEQRRETYRANLAQLGGAFGGYYAAQMQEMDLQRRYGRGTSAAARTELQSAGSQLAALRQARQSGQGIVTDEQLQGAAALYEAKLQRFVELRQKEQAVVMQTAGREIAAAEKKLSVLEAGLSAQERFGSLDRGEQQRIARAARTGMEQGFTSVQQAQDVLRFAAEGSDLQQRARQYLRQRGSGLFGQFAGGYATAAGTSGGSLDSQARSIRSNLKDLRSQADESGKRVADEINKIMEGGFTTLSRSMSSRVSEAENRIQALINQNFSGVRDQIQIRQAAEDAAG